jgi:hypothetical protein
MTLASYQTDDYYTKVLKMTVSTNDKTSPLASDFNYEVRLPEAVDNVIGMKLVEWSFSRDVIPTFYPKTTTLVGNNRLDFRLTNPDISITPGDFTVKLPRRALDYRNNYDITRDFVDVMSAVMQNAVDADPVWADQVRVGAEYNSQLRSFLGVSTLNTDIARTKLTLLFASGPSRPSFISRTLGFDQVDVESVSVPFDGVEFILSPYPTRLRPSDYLDVFVDESPQRPMQRIFFDDPLRTRNSISAQGFHRFEVDTERPPRRLDRLHIRIRYRNNIDPGASIEGDGEVFTMPNFMTFHFLTVQDSILSRPGYVKQDLSY